MKENEFAQFMNGFKRPHVFIGGGLVAIGCIVLLDQYFKTGWLALTILPAIGLLFLGEGLLRHKMGFSIAGSIISGLGIGLFFALSWLSNLSTIKRIGVMLVAFAMGWFLIMMISAFTRKKIAWWAIIPGGSIGSLGACFLFSPLTFLDFVLYISLGTGLSLLIWGINTRLLGLIIPGCIVSTCGIGVYVAWSRISETNGLAQTGMMLVCFAFGWILITIFSRVVTEKFVWWPLIPGGILAMVGWGLYIGGNPGNAVSFIGNTGSIALIVFGLYLVLMRSGIHQ